MLKESGSVPQKIIDTVDSPEDIRQLSIDELVLLASQIREKIIDTVSVTGGHLAPSLGVVELTIALHYIFNTPKDKLVWDVGHQSYAHKILTGRRKNFGTIRQYKGISGFPKMKESEFDAFETGHSSTSISAALGMALGMHLDNQDDIAIAVIGDGSMTAGMAFEALNHAGDLDKNLIVILNDNEMSISPNVGALSSFLSRKLTGKTMRRVKSHLVDKLQVSDVGENILNVLRKSEESFKSFFTPGMLFEAFKFDYIGPIDGHDLEGLTSTFKTVKDTIKGPALIHVLTQKGKGYDPAVKTPDAFHGLGPFDVKSGKAIKKGTPPISYTEVFGKTMLELGKTNEKLVAISAAMVSGTGLAPFAKAYPDRFFDVGIAEQHAVTFAAGLAAQGMKPVVAVYSTFFQRAMDQIIHDICIPKLPVILAIDRAGVVGDDGPTHHGVFDISFLRFIPNLVIMAPKNEAELQEMLKTAEQHDGPVAIRYPRGAGEGVTLQPASNIRTLEIGKAELLHEGNDILLLPVGNRVSAAVAAAKELVKQGVSVSVINPRFIKPLDASIITQEAQRIGKLITIEDNTFVGGFGSSILELLSSNGIYNVKTRLLGHPDNFVEQGPQPTLWKNSKIDAEAIIKAALELM